MHPSTSNARRLFVPLVVHACTAPCRLTVSHTPPRTYPSAPPLNSGHRYPVNEKYEDVAGLVLPPETSVFLDTWKRPEELVLNAPDVPMVLTVQQEPPPEAAAGEGGKGAKVAKAKDAPLVLSRELEGTLSAGHRTFEWLQAVFVMVISAQVGVEGEWCAVRWWGGGGAHGVCGSGCGRGSRGPLGRWQQEADWQ